MNKSRWARVLIVEDSPTAGRILVDGISRDPRLAVAGVALTANEAVTLADQLKPDVITVDLMLPDETGLDVVLRVLRTGYVPIIVVTGLPQNGSNLAFRSLLAGAADIILKPHGAQEQLNEFFADLNERIASLASAAVPTHRPTLRPTRRKPPTNGATVGCVVVGASTGGPTALVEFLGALGPNFVAPIVIVQHIAAPFVGGLVKWLDQETPLPVKLAENGDLLEPGRGYVAPASCDLSIAVGGRLSVTPVATEPRAHRAVRGCAIRICRCGLRVALRGGAPLRNGEGRRCRSSQSAQQRRQDVRPGST